MKVPYLSLGHSQNKWGYIVSELEESVMLHPLRETQAAGSRQQALVSRLSSLLYILSYLSSLLVSRLVSLIVYILSFICMF